MRFAPDTILLPSGRMARGIALALLLVGLPGSTSDVRYGEGAKHHHAMNDADMAREVAAWFRVHPAHGNGVLAASAAPVDTFLTSSFIFDTDGNLGTQIDTAHVTTGQTVLFKWVVGSHTTTSGNPGDIDAGSLWDGPLNNLSPANNQFAVTFNAVGTFPFFCRPHGQFFDMKGVVVVTESVSAPPTSPLGIGFVADPAPNPTRSGAAFRFALARAGHVQLEVFDASGRRLATPIDGAFAPGVHAGAWDGLVAGERTPAGIYFLRLHMAEGTETRRLVIER